MANQIHEFTIDYGKFKVKLDRYTVYVFCFLTLMAALSLIHVKNMCKELSKYISL